jgi:septal ring factor EnvC (AmiA/AmiB activator)
MKQCTGLWIVAPITRAVDDKTAKKLLGDSFRRQLMYDGTYSAVTFICSKTDDISVTEVADSLGLEDRFAEDWAKIDEVDATLEKRATHIQELKDQKAALADLLDSVENEWDQWDDLSQKFSDGRTVYASSPHAGKKRKRTVESSKSRKKRLSIDTDSGASSDNETDYDSHSGSDKENGGPDEDDDRVPLTEEQIEEKLSHLKAQKKALREQRRQIEEQISQVRTEMKDLTLKKGKLDGKGRAVCIKGRNSYSREAIKNDFAQGIKE